ILHSLSFYSRLRNTAKLLLPNQSISVTILSLPLSPP
ncbi:unnamed protein product, partial [Brassica oleracea var. botrytis]